MTGSMLLAAAVCSENHQPFDALATVSLDELNGQAALQTRTDRKYLIAAADLASLAAMLPTTTRVLEIDGRRRSAYQSTYFDTPAVDSYLGAARARPNRFKVRVRTYLDNDAHYLEVKTRDRSRRTSKVRCSVAADSHLHLGADGHAFVVDRLTDELVGRAGADHAAMVGSLQPTLRTHYERTTLLIAPQLGGARRTSAPSRATVDTSLAFSAPGQPRSSHPDLAIIETKTVGPPSAVDRLLWRHGHRPAKVSKYAIGLALFNPDLPATKWNRILRRDFGWKPDHEL